MRIPRDMTGDELVKILRGLGYEPVRQVGSHVRLIHNGPPKHGVTIPLHYPIKVGTLNRILGEVAENLKISKQQILNK